MSATPLEKSVADDASTSKEGRGYPRARQRTAVTWRLECGWPNIGARHLPVRSGMTALVAASLAVEGRLDLAMTARSVFGEHLPLIDDDVTVGNLFAHRSGIGDYFDEDAVESLTDCVMPVPVHQLGTTSDYLAVLNGHPQVCASGRAVCLQRRLRRLGLDLRTIRWHAVRRAHADPGVRARRDVRHRVPALGRGRGRMALGYLAIDGQRTNALHLPFRGSGDGGISTAAADVSALREALYAGRIVPREWVATMMSPHSEVPAESARYGLGFWLHPTSDAVILEGCDAGVSFRTVHDQATGVTHMVL